MNPRIRSVLIVIGLLTLIVIGIIVIPRTVSLYYQTKGGQQVEYVLRFKEGIHELVCEQLPPADEDGRYEVENGVADLNRAIRYNKNNAQAYYYLGKANCLLGNPSDALKNYSQYTGLRPENPLGYIGLGFAYEELGDPAAVSYAWRSADLTANDFNQAGDEVFKAKQYESAILWYERAKLVEPKSAETWLKIGKAYDALNAYESALEAYLKAWESDPELSTASLIDSYNRNGDLNSVKGVLQLMLERYPDSSDRLLWFQELGSSYLSHGEYDQAVELYTLAIKEFADQHDLYISLGWAFYERGDGFESASNEFEKAISLDEANGSGYYSMGLLFNQEKNYIEAEQWFRKATEVEPDRIWYAINLGNALRNAGNLESAIKVYEEIIALNPNYDRVFHEIALAYYLSNRIEDAVIASDKSITLASSPDHWYYTRAGVIFEAAGDLETALRYYYQALAIKPSFPSALEGVSRLEDKNN